MDDKEVARYWDENAPDWAWGVRSGFDVYRDYVNNPGFLAVLPNLKGLRVLDVGCGEGTNTRLLADRGARMTGVDISEKMIAAARQHEAAQPQDIQYHVAGGNDLSLFPAASFDAAVSTMAMMDMADYAGCVAEVARVLKGEGLFQFSISHPCSMTRRWRWIRDPQGQREGFLVGNYFGLTPGAGDQEIDEFFFGAAPPEAKAKARKFRIPRFCRTLSEYFNTLVDAGFEVEHLAEPYASESAAAACPNVADTRIAPYTLIFRCRKRRRPTTERPR